MKPYEQGSLDNLCGVYSIVNAERIVNGSSLQRSQILFDQIIMYLSRKRKLSSVIREGINHRLMIGIMNEISYYFGMAESNKRGFSSISEWWEYSSDFLVESANRCIILSLDGVHSHLTVIESMKKDSMRLLDSGRIKVIRKSRCRLPFEMEPNYHAIYYAQCFYLGLDKS